MPMPPNPTTTVNPDPIGDYAAAAADHQAGVTGRLLDAEQADDHAVIGYEQTAQQLDAEGQTRLARIQRLTVGEARLALCYLDGLDPDALDAALELVEGWR